MSSPKVTVSYWDCRGYAHPILLLLEHTQTPYEYVRQKCDPGPTYTKKEWNANKYKLMEGFDFPNLPFYDDHQGNKLTHTMAILQHLGRKHNLVLPSDSKESEKCGLDMIQEQLRDLAFAVIDYTYFPDLRAKGELSVPPELVESANALFISTITPMLKDLNAKIESMQQNRSSVSGGGDSAIWGVSGPNLTYVDFFAYEQFDYVRLLMEPNFMEKLCPKIVEFMKAFEGLPQIKLYLESERFSKYPLYGERSYLGRRGPKN